MPRTLAARNITEGVIWEQLLSFFFPILLGTFFQQMYNTADTIIVGRFVGTRALAAVGSVGSLNNLIISLFIGLSVGANVLVARFTGSRENKNVSETVHTAVLLSLVGGVLLTVVGVTLARPLLHMMGSPEDVFDNPRSEKTRTFLRGTQEKF